MHGQRVRLLRSLQVTNVDEHAEWVRAAVRDALGVSDDGGLVDITPAKLAHVAETARKATITWMIGAAQNGQLDHHVCDGMCTHG